MCGISVEGKCIYSILFYSTVEMDLPESGSIKGEARIVLLVQPAPIL
jgi:hypothetical protein